MINRMYFYITLYNEIITWVLYHKYSIVQSPTPGSHVLTKLYSLHQHFNFKSDKISPVCLYTTNYIFIKICKHSCSLQKM